MDKTLIIQKIKMAMQQQGISLTMLAQRTKISKPTLSRYLAGQRNMQIETLCQISKALNLTAGDFALPADYIALDEVMQSKHLCWHKELLDTKVQKLLSDVIQLVADDLTHQ